MNKTLIEAIFSLSGVAIAIGVLGFMGATVTIFIDVNAQLSIRWLLFTLLVLGSVILILLKLIHDLLSATTPPPSFECPIQSVPDDDVLVIRRNENFVNHILVGCYVRQQEIERLAYIGMVHLVQEKIIQIKVTQDCGVLSSMPTAVKELKQVIVRPVVPVTALQHLTRSPHE